MAKEKNITAVTSVAAADFARVVTSAGASVKATFANVAKYIIETYNGSTVAGSAQSVKSALDSLNSKSLFAIKTLEGITNTSTGKIYDLLNLPNNNRTYLVIFRYNAYTFTNSSSIYMFTNGTTTHCYGVDCIYKGSESRTVVLDSDGTVHTGAANTYNMQAFYKPIT